MSQFFIVAFSNTFFFSSCVSCWSTMCVYVYDNYLSLFCVNLKSVKHCFAWNMNRNCGKGVENLSQQNCGWIRWKMPFKLLHLNGRLFRGQNIFFFLFCYGIQYFFFFIISGLMRLHHIYCSLYYFFFSSIVRNRWTQAFS